MVSMKRLFLFALTALVLGSCAQDKTEDIALNDGQTIYATIAEMEGAGRVQLNENKQTTWTAGDHIVVYSATQMLEYEFTGNTGDRSGSFRNLGYYNIDMSQFNIPENQWWAVYSTDGRYKPQLINTNLGPLPYFLMDIPNTTDYIKGSYGLSANAMLGSSNDGANFQFINLFGYLRISAVGSQKVTRVILESLTGETMLAGHFAVVPDYPNATIGFDADPDAVPYQVINCGEGVQLSNTPTDFYFALKPMNIEGGINVTLEFEDGSTYTKSTDKTIPIVRNTIQPMAVINANASVESQVATIYHSGTTVYAPLLEGSRVSGRIEWGDGAYSMLDALTSSYTYEDGQSSHVITITATNATSLSLDRCTGITKIDLSNF